jgi:hypothetical protein
MSDPNDIDPLDAAKGIFAGLWISVMLWWALLVLFGSC